MPSALYCLAAVGYCLAWLFAMSLAKAASDGDRLSRPSNLDDEWAMVCKEYERLYGED